ncbi:hypothetical protein ScPMuIL_013954 [Solemya velum]
MADNKVIVNNTERLKVFVEKFLEKGTKVEYHVSEEEHLFMVMCEVGGQSSLGQAVTKKKAKQVAACKMLEIFGERGIPVEDETARPPDYVSDLNKIMMRLRWTASYSCSPTGKSTSVTLNVQDLYTTVGTATNKKSAKQAAAKALLDLLPAMVLYIGSGKFGNVAMQSAHAPEQSCNQAIACGSVRTPKEFVLSPLAVGTMASFALDARKKCATFSLHGVGWEFHLTITNRELIKEACLFASVFGNGEMELADPQRRAAICGKMIAESHRRPAAICAKMITKELQRPAATCGKVAPITIDDEERSPLLHMVGAYEDIELTTEAPTGGDKTGDLDPEYRPRCRSVDHVMWLLGVRKRA